MKRIQGSRRKEDLVPTQALHDALELAQARTGRSRSDLLERALEAGIAQVTGKAAIPASSLPGLIGPRLSTRYQFTLTLELAGRLDALLERWGLALEDTGPKARHNVERAEVVRLLANLGASSLEHVSSYTAPSVPAKKSHRASKARP